MRVLTTLGAVALLGVIGTPVARADWDELAITPQGAVEGYTSEVSARPGERIHFHIQANPARRYRLAIYRLGAWAGSGPKRLACVPSCQTSSPGKPRRTPAPGASGKVDVHWPVTDRFKIPADWRSGLYVAKAVLVGGRYKGMGRLIPFVVRAKKGARSAILVQVPVSTWQAYNGWGGKSLYTATSSKGPPAVRVSFNRPYGEVHVGGHSLFDYEIQVARFLDRGRWDVSYTTDVDVAQDPGTLLGHRLDMSIGDDEYWSKEQFDGFERARGSGVNLAFMGAGAAQYQVRYEDGGRTIVSYKSQADPYPDPRQKTVRFRDLKPARPECRLIGVQKPDGASIGGLGLNFPVADGALSNPWFDGTGFEPGSWIGLGVGPIWDRAQPSCKPPVTPTELFHLEGPVGTPSADSVTYRMPSGSTVFAAGSLQFSWSLDGYGAALGHVDPRVQRFATNVINSLAGTPPPA